MNARWLAMILMWVAMAATTVGTAHAWGAQGRGTTLTLGVVLGIVLGIVTGKVADTETHESEHDG